MSCFFPLQDFLSPGVYSSGARRRIAKKARLDFVPDVSVQSENRAAERLTCGSGRIDSSVCDHDAKRLSVERLLTINVPLAAGVSEDCFACLAS